MIALPPIVGSKQIWSNKQTDYNSFPPDLDAFRELVYALEKPTLLTSQQYADYWPHISNIFNRSLRSTHCPNGTRWEQHSCRHARRVNIRRRPPLPDDQRKRKRKVIDLAAEDEKPCAMRFRLVMYINHAATPEDHKTCLGSCLCVPDWVHLEQMPKSEPHNHELDSLDRFRRADSLKYFAKHKCEEGPYMPDAVLTWMKAKFGEVTKQMAYFTEFDIATAAWKTIRDKGPEMKQEVDDVEEMEAVERRACVDAVATTTVEGLKQALLALLAAHPEAVKTVKPLLDAAQLPTLPVENKDGLSHKHIMYGEDIRVPDPGFPSKMQDGSIYRRPANPKLPTKGYIRADPAMLAKLKRQQDYVVIGLGMGGGGGGLPYQASSSVQAGQGRPYPSLPPAPASQPQGRRSDMPPVMIQPQPHAAHPPQHPPPPTHPPATSNTLSLIHYSSPYAHHSAHQPHPQAAPAHHHNLTTLHRPLRLNLAKYRPPRSPIAHSH